MTGGGGVAGIWWVKVRAVNKIVYNAQESLPITEYPAPNVNSTALEKPWYWEKTENVLGL